MSGTANNNVSGSFYNLLNQYNATSGTTGATTIVQLPLAFVRSYAVNVYDGKMWYLGQNGHYWSRTAKSSTDAYDLYFDTTGVNPSLNDYRWYGLPLRCLYPGVNLRFVCGVQLYSCDEPQVCAQLYWFCGRRPPWPGFCVQPYGESGGVCWRILWRFAFQCEQ